MHGIVSVTALLGFLVAILLPGRHATSAVHLLRSSGGGRVMSSVPFVDTLIRQRTAPSSYREVLGDRTQSYQAIKKAEIWRRAAFFFFKTYIV